MPSLPLPLPLPLALTLALTLPLPQDNIYDDELIRAFELGRAHSKGGKGSQRAGPARTSASYMSGSKVRARVRVRIRVRVRVRARVTSSTVQCCSASG